MSYIKLLHSISFFVSTIYSFKITKSRVHKNFVLMSTLTPRVNVEQGKKLPDRILNIKLNKDDGKDTSLKSILSELPKGYKGIVLFIYPMANTPGCTSQACDFRDNYEIIKNKGFLTYGVSADSPESQTKWKTKHNFPYILLCDRKKELISALECRSMVLFTSRSHLIIDKSGVVLFIERGVSPSDSRRNCVDFIDSM